jgi:Flp pilus assembly protein TadG
MVTILFRPPRRVTQRRKGSATVELAVCLPVLMIIAMGSIEATNAIFLKQHLTSAAYEGARAAIAPGQTSAGATTAAQSVLTAFGISGATVTITPTVTTSTSSGTQITVTVSAPLSSNSWMSPFIVGKTITTVAATAIMDHQ